MVPSFEYYSEFTTPVPLFEGDVGIADRGSVAAGGNSIEKFCVMVKSNG